jgi:hypothetical protein
MTDERKVALVTGSALNIGRAIAPGCDAKPICPHSQ